MYISLTIVYLIEIDLNGFKSFFFSFCDKQIDLNKFQRTNIILAALFKRLYRNCNINEFIQFVYIYK